MELIRATEGRHGADVISLLQELDRVFGLAPGIARKPVVIVMDNSPIYVGRATKKALEARALWLAVEWLPKYAPEPDEIERSWRRLKACHLAHKVFANEGELEKAIHQAVANMNAERANQPLADFRISA